MNRDPLVALTPVVLRSLAGAFRDGALASGLSDRYLRQIVGPQAEPVGERLAAWLGAGMLPAHAALALDALATSREEAAAPSLILDLVLSGPDVAGIPTSDTGAAMHSLIEAAQAQILLVGYAVHKGHDLFARLAERMADRPDLRVTFCLDISRPWNDTSLSSEIVRRFAHDFRTRQWPWPNLPDLYYDPRSLGESATERSCLHAKCVIVDRRDALVTSANFTEAAHERNIEVGVRIRYEPLVERLANYFAGLIATGALVRCDLQTT